MCVCLCFVCVCVSACTRGYLGTYGGQKSVSEPWAGDAMLVSHLTYVLRSELQTHDWAVSAFNIESSAHPNVVFQFKRERNLVQYDTWVTGLGMEGQTHIPMHGLLISLILVKIMSTHSQAYQLNNFKGSVHLLVELIFGSIFFLSNSPVKQ